MATVQLLCCASLGPLRSARAPGARVAGITGRRPGRAAAPAGPRISALAFVGLQHSDVLDGSSSGACMRVFRPHVARMWPAQLLVLVWS